MIPIFMTARARIGRERRMVDVTVLIGDLTEFVHKKPKELIAIEHDGEEYYVMKRRLHDVSFATRRGTNAVAQVCPPCVEGARRYTAQDAQILRRLKRGDYSPAAANEGLGVYILPGLPDGRVEYQVSNGLDGKRSFSFDHYTYREAKKAFDRIVSKGGWGKENHGNR